MILTTISTEISQVNEVIPQSMFPMSDAILKNHTQRRSICFVIQSEKKMAAHSKLTIEIAE